MFGQVRTLRHQPTSSLLPQRTQIARTIGFTALPIRRTEGHAHTLNAAGASPNLGQTAQGTVSTNLPLKTELYGEMTRLRFHALSDSCMTWKLMYRNHSSMTIQTAKSRSQSCSVGKRCSRIQSRALLFLG